ncbi:MAG: TrkA C-terminal domain-containing protein [Ilumatobacter sp.]|nr:TrkA C-terminal domain-containing protein [Ilumatobacter sp.]
MAFRVVAGDHVGPGVPQTRAATLRYSGQNEEMTEVRETQLPGVGVKHDFTTDDGREVGVLAHKDGRREIVVYDAVDTDKCSVQMSLSATDTRTLAELLGTSQVNRAIQAAQQEIEGLAIDWLTIESDSPSADKSIGDGEFRTRTGVSIVAVIRGDTPFPAPGPDFGLRSNDVAVCVGTMDGLDRMRQLIAPR